MSIQIKTKLNYLLEVLPEGLLVDIKWLQNKGFSRQLIAKYVKSNWLKSPIRGLYRRNSTLIAQDSWESIVLSLQMLLELPITVGGRSALDAQGFAHYLSLSNTKEIHLYSNYKMPNWLNSVSANATFIQHSGKLFKTDASKSDTEESLKRASFLNYNWANSINSLRLSTPERAILELIDELPMKESFHQVDAVMESLSNLRPNALNILLRDCNSVKTKRLFLWFAKRHNHSWYHLLDRESFDLGAGKRALVAGGRFDQEFMITVPEDLDNAQ